MQQIHLRDVDLNLLVVLDVLLQEQSVTKAAARLHRTQSAVSHALNRLRDVFGDELLVRDGRRMRPTLRAVGLAKALPPLLAQVHRTLSPPPPFVPETSNRTFRLAAPDFVAPMIPSLLFRLGREAPGARVAIDAVTPAAIAALADGGLDGLIAPPSVASEALRETPLGRWSWSVYGRAGHPAFVDWSDEAWSAWPHLRVRTASPTDHGPVDRAAVAHGLTRAVGGVVPQFSMVPAVLAETDLLFTAPSMAMGRAAEAYGLVAMPVPMRIAPMALSLFRSATLGGEPGTQWFLDRVAGVASTL